MRTNIIAAMALCAWPGMAQTEIHVLVSNGVKAVMDELRGKGESAIGHPLSTEFNSSTMLKQKIEAGEPFDAVIVTSDLMDELIKEGKIASGTSKNLARSSIGIGIRAGAPKPDIRNSAALKQTLLKAKSITYAQDGASREYILKMFDRLGIAAEIKSKIISEQGSGRATARVADGSAELVLTLISEILPVRGIELLGPLPQEFQHVVTFSVAAGATARDTDSVKALIKFLTGPSVVPTLKAKGMER